MSTALQQDALRELGWRLRHHCAARSVDPDTLAAQVGVTPDDFALALVGAYELPFSTVCAILERLDLEWGQLYGTELSRRRTIYDLTLESNAWHAIESGRQPFDIRRDVEHYRVGDWLRLYEKVDTHRTGRVLIREVTYLWYLASVDLPPGYVAMALRPVDRSQHSAASSSETQPVARRASVDAGAMPPDHDRQQSPARQPEAVFEGYAPEPEVSYE